MPNENKKPEGKTKPDQPNQQQRDNEREKRFHARLALDPSITGAIAIAPFSTTLVEPIALAECLVEQSRMVNDGNLQRAEAMLITQAHTLDSIFSSLARRSAANMGENVQTAERYMRLALKAQSQCRATLQTLTKMGDIHQRVGIEIPRSRVRRAVEQLVKEGTLFQGGVRSGTRYRLPDLAQSQLYPSSASQGNALNGPVRPLTHCPIEYFSLAHKLYLSQRVGQRALSDNLRCVGVNWPIATLNVLRSRLGER